jgi:uncharacterized protein YndB with AHSA1/START domain
MARNEHLMHASPEAVFDVLADPRSYAYWVLGSEEIRDADVSWPARGSRFHHTVKIGPLRLKDHSEVEDVRPGRFLQLKVKGRPFGTARVKIELAPAEGGTRVTMIEDPGDTASAFVFTPLTHLLVCGRNVRSLDRLAELAEGRVPIPGEEPGAPNRGVHGSGSVQNPIARARRDALAQTLATLAQGAGAGFAGAIAMSVSTNAEMRLRGRPPSDAPAKALARLFGVSTRGTHRKMQLALAGHVATSITLGAARGALARRDVRPGPAGAALFALALAPEIVVVPALGAAAPPWRWSAADAAVSVLHHGVYALTTNACYGWLEARAGSRPPAS